MTINYSIQFDEETGKWFFIIFSTKNADVYESDPGFGTETEATETALRWITDNLLYGSGNQDD